jgi:tetratricopeptide (TPR) repeat protein
MLEEADAIFEEGQWFFITKDQLAAHAYRLMGDHEPAKELYHKALNSLQTEIAKRPDDDRVLSSLGIVYAGLGQREKALADSERAVELMPISRNAFIGPFRIEDQAFVFAMTGEYDKALDRIEYLLEIPSWFSIHLLRIDPRWDPLRHYPRYKTILEKYGGSDGF